MQVCASLGPHLKTLSSQDEWCPDIQSLSHSFLSPIGQHRRAHIKPSKGKRSRAKKRKRDQAEAKDEEDVPAPPPPAVASCVDVGLSNITRNLQIRADNKFTTKAAKGQKSPRQSEAYNLVFVVRSGPPSAFFNHLPQMVAVASKAWALSEPVRLVGFSKSCEERLSACMGIPRVTSVAIKQSDVAQLRALVNFVRERVPPVRAPWLEEAGQVVFRETKINTIQAAVGKKRQKKA